MQQIDQTHPKSLVTILGDILVDKDLSAAAHWDINDKTRAGVFARSWDSINKHASHRRVNPDNLEEAASEIANAAGKLWLLSPLNGEP